MPTTTEQPTDTKKKRGSRPKVEQMPAPAPSEAEAAPPEPEPPPPAEPEAPTGDEYQRRGRGRPARGETSLPAEGFFDLISSVTNWDDNQVWVYRIEPNTDRLAQGKAKFIKIWKEPCSEEGIMRTEGSGVYSLLWKRRPAPESPLVPFRKLERLEIENPNFPRASSREIGSKPARTNVGRGPEGI